MKEKLSFLKKKPFIFGMVALILIVVGVFIFNKKTANNQTITVQHTDFVNRVSVSGKVVATEDVNLGFKSDGRIEHIYFSVGQLVKNNTLIAQIDAKDAEKALHDAEISLASAKLSLEKLQLQSSNENLGADLQKAYDDGFIAVSDAFLDLPSTITGLDSLLNQENVSDNVARNSGSIALSYKKEAETLYYKAKDVFEKNRNNFRILDRNSPRADIEKIINETYDTTKILMDAIKSLKNLEDYLAEDTNMASNYTSSQSTLYEYTNTINGHLSSLLAIKNSIKNYKDAFPDIGLDMQTSLLSIKQKENALQDAKHKLEDYYIRAPFDGIITKMDAKVGEMASPNVSLVTMMSADIFQIESYVPEVSIAQIKLDDEASVTLDAYGENVLFYAKVISIDPAETIKDGVSTYKIKLQFYQKDDRIKSGMTANVSITTFNKPNVIAIPGGVVFEKNGQKFVQIKENNNVSDREIFTGSVSSLGQVEVVSGLADGEQIVLNPKVN